MSNHYHFREQHAGEKVLHIIHRHWFNLFSHLFSVILAAVAIAGSFLILPALFPEALDPMHYQLFSFVQNTLILLVWLYGFLIWIDYYYDVWIITSERIINIEQKGLFVRDVSELNLSRIQDVTTEVKGIVPTILNYGDVFVQTAGEEEHFVFRQVGDPYRIKDMIMQFSKNNARDDLRNAISTIKDAS